MPVTTQQPIAAEMQETWTKIRDVLAGEDAVKEKAETYLPRLPGQRRLRINDEWVDLYEPYLDRAVLLPFAGPLVSRLLGMVFRRAPVFTVPAVAEAHLENIALTAPTTTAENLAKMAVRECLTTGLGAISVNWDEQQRRPYQRHYLAHNVVNWREELVGSVPTPTRIVLREYIEEEDDDDPFEVEAVEQYRVYTLVDGVAQVEVWRLESEAAQWQVVDSTIILTRRQVPLTFLPVVPVTPFGVQWTVEQPPVRDLVDLVLSHYKLSADYYQLLHLCGAGSVLFGAGLSETEQTRITTVGGGTIILSENAGANLQYVQTNGAAGAEIKTAMADLVGQMGIAAGRLMLAQTKNVAESGAALELQFSGDDANLQQIAGAVAMALEAALRMHVWWMGTAATPDDLDDVRVELNDQFVSQRLLPQDVVSLASAADMGALMDEDLFWQLQRGEVLDPLTDFDRWQANRTRQPAPTHTSPTQDVPETEAETQDEEASATEEAD